MRFCRPLLLAALSGAAILAGPAHARDSHGAPYIAPDEGVYEDGWGDDYYGERYDAPPLPPQPEPYGYQRGYGEDEREAWLRECHRRYSDNGVGGAVIGGVLGGVAGNRIAGSGHRTLGTVAGAAVGAAAGAAIDKGEDRDRARMMCEDYLARYEAGYGHGGRPAHGQAPGYGGYTYGYGYGYGQPMAYMPVMLPGCACNCRPKTKEVVIEEWVDERPAARVIPKRPAPARTKLVPIRTKAIPIKGK